MSRPIIEVSGLGKRYRLGAIGPGSLREALTGWRRTAGAARDFDALQEVSFQVQPGEVVGVIGRNGAGKSTLLKLLSRITAPTSGRAVLRGRVASLLEVGTGFHPDLSGRENIYLNGAILGMSRAEIRRKFDEIVAFAEVERFLDTPVKRYSSGMYVRLAFAVAAHLEPEILIVDEVLAVGDSAFQRKCLGKMGQVAAAGRTILFVSHNLAAVRTLCRRGLLLAGGRLVADATAGEAVDRYLAGSGGPAGGRSWPEEEAPGNEHIRLLGAEVAPPEGEAAITVDTGAEIAVTFRNARAGINLDCTIYVVTPEGLVLFESGCIVSSADDALAGVYRVRGRVPGHLLNAGRYQLNLLFGRDQRHLLFKADEVAGFEVENTATGRGRNLSVAPGVVRPLIDWRFDPPAS